MTEVVLGPDCDALLEKGSVGLYKGPGPNRTIENSNIEVGTLEVLRVLPSNNLFCSQAVYPNSGLGKLRRAKRESLSMPDNAVQSHMESKAKRKMGVPIGR